MIFKLFVALIVFNLSTAAPPPASEYIGCCKDGAGGVRDLPVKMNLTVTSNQQCQTLCGNYGYAFAGTQNGNQCWCGYNKCSQGIFLDTFCAKPCSDTTVSQSNKRYYHSHLFIIAASVRQYIKPKLRVQGTHSLRRMRSRRSKRSHFAVLCVQRQHQE